MGENGRQRRFYLSEVCLPEDVQDVFAIKLHLDIRRASVPIAPFGAFLGLGKQDLRSSGEGQVVWGLSFVLLHKLTYFSDRHWQN